MSIKNYELVTKTIIEWMKGKMNEAGTARLSVDISGGVDSAVVAALSAMAAGSENVVGIYSGCHSTRESLERAREVSQKFNIKLVEYNFEAAFNDIVTQCRSAFNSLGIDFPDGDGAKIVYGSLRSTLRAPIGRFTNRAFMGGLRVGTGNRDEDELVRFYQKGGDGEVDISPIAGLFKSEVWELAEYLGVPGSVITAKPTPDLWGVGDEHNDEDELAQITGVALTYTRPGGALGTIEWASRENERVGVITGELSSVSKDELIGIYGYTEDEASVIAAVRKMEAITRHKALPPPYLERRAFQSIGSVE